MDPATQIHISGTGDWGHCNPNCPSGRNLNQVEEAIEDIPDEPCKTIFGDDGICQVSKNIQDSLASSSFLTSYCFLLNLGRTAFTETLFVSKIQRVHQNC